MQRRTFVTTVAASLGTTALAGCVSGGSDGAAGPGESATDDSDDGPTDTRDQPTETTDKSPDTSEPPALTDRSLERREGCSGTGSASVSTDSNAVVIEGCIAGKNGCQVPKLADAVYDVQADELTVTVTTEDGDDADVCTQRIVELGYAATLTFEGGLPKTTVVVHEGAGDEGEVARTETN